LRNVCHSKDDRAKKEYRKAHYRTNRTAQLLYTQQVVQALRTKVVEKLGGQCSNPDCRHLNSDGTLGCKDFRLLQIDHVFGGGEAERKTLHIQAFLKKVLADTSGKYQLLCASCNWLKRYLNHEV
jgi:hypothetical protein